MAQQAKRNPKAMWIGAAFSVVLLGAFLWLKFEDSSVLALQPQWLLVALVPMIVGLVMGGYVREFKVGDYGVGFATDEILEKSKPIESGSPDTAKEFIGAPPLTGWQSERAKEYARTHGYMLAHVYRRSSMPGQEFDVSIFVVRHQKGTPTPPRDKLQELTSAEFFFGESWGNKVFPTSGDGGFFGVRTHAWGTFLATCRVSFKDHNQQPIVLLRYIDFSMADELE